MTNLKYISLGEYLQLSDADKSVYDLLLKSVEPDRKGIRVKFDGRFIMIKPKHYDLWDFSYSDMIELKKALSEQDGIELTTELIQIVYSLNVRSKLMDINVLDVFTGLKWVVEELKDIIMIEHSELSCVPDEKEKAAGIEELIRFEHYPTIKSLCSSLNKSKDEVLRMPYSEIFLELCYNKTIGEINKRLVKNVG